MKVLAVNPGSTSTKIAVFDGETCLFKKSIEHEPADLASFERVSDQLPYREHMVLDALAENGMAPEDMDAFSARGGGLASHEGGCFRVNDIMVQHAHDELYASHPAVLGVQIARRLEERTGRPAYMVNSPSTDEMAQVARITGVKGIYRHCYTHALNQKEVAERYAEGVGRRYDELNLVVCHIGGGVSVTAHEHGRMVDTNDIIDGDGPMAPTRVGSLPALEVTRMCKAENPDVVAKRIRSQAGFVSHLGTYDAREIRSRIEVGDAYAKNVYDSFIYQIAKYVGSMAAAMKFEVDAVVLTGGIAHDDYLVEALRSYVGKLVPVAVMPGEFEMEALAFGVMRALEAGEVHEYTGVPVWDESKLWEVADPTV